MLSQQSKYALRAVMYLNRLGSNKYLRVEQIAEATGLPAPYLSKLLKLLVQHGLLISRRGKNGGVALNPNKDKVTFYDICLALEDPIILSECVLFKKPCNEEHHCAFHKKWAATKKRLLEFLDQEKL